MICCCLNSGWFVYFIRLLPQLWKVVGGHIYGWMMRTLLLLSILSFGYLELIWCCVWEWELMTVLWIGCRCGRCCKRVSPVARTIVVSVAGRRTPQISFALIKTQDLMLQPRLRPSPYSRPLSTVSGSNPSMQAGGFPYAWYTYGRLHATSSPRLFAATPPPPPHPRCKKHHYFIQPSRWPSPTPSTLHHITFAIMPRPMTSYWPSHRRHYLEGIVFVNRQMIWRTRILPSPSPSNPPQDITRSITPSSPLPISRYSVGL